jgi:hypothetical protein
LNGRSQASPNYLGRSSHATSSRSIGRRPRESDARKKPGRCCCRPDTDSRASYTVPITTLASDVSAYGQRERGLAVLKAFFDDSGTHDSADVSVMGGLIAHEDEWAVLETEWARALGELKLRKMQMSSCERGWKQFKEWNRDERERAIARFGAIIEKMNARMLMAAVSRDCWNAVAPHTRLGEAFAEPIDFCFNACMRHALESKRRSAKARELVVVTFDCREESVDHWRSLARSYERRYPDRVASFAFSSMEKVLSLQAADMIAYEGFRFQCSREKLGGAEPQAGPNFAKLLKALPLKGGFYTEEQLRDYALKLESYSRS